MTEEKKDTILDLDEFFPDDKEVVIKKKVYKVSGSASVKTTLALLKTAEKWQKAPTSEESVSALVESIQAFFITPIEKKEIEALDVAGQLPKLIAFLYGHDIKKIKGTAEKNADSQPPK